MTQTGRSAIDNHRCPVDGCNRQVPPQHLMCGRHWRLVHPNLQRRLYAAYDRGRGALSEAHVEAMNECIDEANWKLDVEEARRDGAAG